ncbi:hypothetical protein PZ938_05120 [Luteipulveratus sp. YIM 133132]|uniref:DUF222 domain-containing protein n=1 Tax=Luteipulveratus flavus TaxID=3031728 RepID=A0ABT6C713_9MICO|nr:MULTISPECIES: hypothetical protein [unclassified Luteipulveratus]MDE9364980.1 hypothetical protein [Luteipulveratus sp. YIM 133132]MDF8264680.1 hypothetical protein [Luteipulveratus sp. YIM 133296]
MAAVVGLSPADGDDPAPLWAAALRRDAARIESLLAAPRADGADDPSLVEALRSVGPAFDACVARHRLDADRWAPALAVHVARLVAARRFAPSSVRRWALTGIWPSLGGDLSATTPQLLTDLTTAAAHLDAVGDVPAWARRMAAATGAWPGEVSDEDLRRLGVVAAWRAGHVRLRGTAMRISGGLPEPVLDAALGVSDAREALQRNKVRPLWWPDGDGWPRRVGGFRGFGGPWRTPPVVLDGDGAEWQVRTREGDWTVVADAFGAAVVPRGESPAAGRPAAAERGAAGVTGVVRAGGAVLTSLASSYQLVLHPEEVAS